MEMPRRVPPTCLEESFIVCASPGRAFEGAASDPSDPRRALDTYSSTRYYIGGWVCPLERLDPGTTKKMLTAVDMVSNRIHYCLFVEALLALGTERRGAPQGPLAFH